MNDSKEQLIVSQGPNPNEVLNQFYKDFMDAYKIERVCCGTQHQPIPLHDANEILLSVTCGVMHIEEKKCLNILTKDFFIEFEENGHNGWAIAPYKHSDLIVFLYQDFIYAFNYDDYHEFCVSYRQLLLHDVGTLVMYDTSLFAKVPIDIFLQIYEATGNDCIKKAVVA